VLAFGLLVTFAIRLPLAAGMSLAAMVALFHGHAHGGELDHVVAPAGYVFGFLTATALLHLLGVGVGWGLSNRRVRVLGACVAFAGATFLAIA
jgi:urease accessory protein